MSYVQVEQLYNKIFLNNNVINRCSFSEELKNCCLNQCENLNNNIIIKNLHINFNSKR